LEVKFEISLSEDSAGHEKIDFVKLHQEGIQTPMYIGKSEFSSKVEHREIHLNHFLNKEKFMKNFYLVALFGITSLVIGCAGTGSSYVPVVAAPKDSKYQKDLADCQKFSEEREYVNSDTKKGAVVGALIGAVSDGIDGAVTGAVIGGGLSAYGVVEEKKGIIKGCMEGRGHKVID
jgi:outer membrane lipoprotein SlyB